MATVFLLLVVPFMAFGVLSLLCKFALMVQKRGDYIAYSYKQLSFPGKWYGVVVQPDGSKLIYNDWDSFAAQLDIIQPKSYKVKLKPGKYEMVFYYVNVVWEEGYELTI